MKKIANILIITGIVLISYFCYQYLAMEKAQNQSLTEAKERIENSERLKDGQSESGQLTFTAEHMEAFGTLEIPKLEKTIGIVEGADEDALEKGVGHMSQTVFPGQGDQIVLSGHRDTVFRNFDKLGIGDQFIVNMPYGDYAYEIRETEIVPEDDTSVVRKMGEEVLVVSTCYPFHFVGNAPERFVAYAYPSN
ncbi:sortase A [Lentibacillus halodurans]|uniref:Sortase A n=1 Tax=Lentibacillus halodurans TaxID=237679 RepID=A0A1I0YBJ4_9BACI|nr:class D sortase [Lentibacillus halodurans]SFB10157.1 sortase A [Lentibacillus halodurans]